MDVHRCDSSLLSYELVSINVVCLDCSLVVS